MTRKEKMPKDNKGEREEHPKNLDYNPDITSEDKEVLNNQSKDEQIDDDFQERTEPVDYAGEDLDIPKDQQKFNQTVNEADDSEKNKRPKDSANSHDSIESRSKTVYKNEEAEKYKDPSEKSRRKE